MRTLMENEFEFKGQIFRRVKKVGDDFTSIHLASPSTVVQGGSLRDYESKDWVYVPRDLLSHIGDWETACRIAMENSPPPKEDLDDASYWKHQLNTLESIKRQLGMIP